MAKRRRNGRNGSGKARRDAPPPPPDFWAVNGQTVFGVLGGVLVLVFAAYGLTAFDWSGEGGKTPDDRNDQPPVGSTMAPTFNVQSIDGASMDLDGYRGKVVVLDLFATWCGPCQRQMQDLNQVRAFYSRSDVVILSIDVDTTETTQQIRDFRDQYNADWDFATDTDGVGAKYGASSIPTLAIIDQEGRLTYKEAGATSFEALRQLIDPLLAGAP